MTFAGFVTALSMNEDAWTAAPSCRHKMEVGREFGSAAPRKVAA